jgi:hypothetical protein
MVKDLNNRIKSQQSLIENPTLTKVFDPWKPFAICSLYFHVVDGQRPQQSLNRNNRIKSQQSLIENPTLAKVFDPWKRFAICSLYLHVVDGQRPQQSLNRNNR